MVCRVVVADANPGIFGLPGSTLASLDESRPGPDSPRAGSGPGHRRQTPVSWRGGQSQPPPNLGPPPERLDWRRRPHE